MDTPIKQLSERLSAQSSRGGFIAAMGKLALGAAAIASGQGLSQAFAAAQVSPDGVPLYCCIGNGCPTNACPSGTHIGYAWICCVTNGGSGYYCDDCYNANNVLICTYPDFACGNCQRSCPCACD